MCKVQAVTNCDSTWVAGRSSESCGAALRDPVGRLRRLIADAPWPESHRPQDVRLRRLWAQRKGRIAAEFQVSAGGPEGSKCWMIQGVSAPAGPPRRGAVGEIAWVGDEPRNLFLADGEQTCWIATPDCDPELRALRPLFGRHALRRLRAHLSGGRSTGVDTLGGVDSDAALRQVAYRIGRRLVMRWSPKAGDGRGCYVKGYRRSPSGEAIRRARDIVSLLAERSFGMVRVPELIDFDWEMGVALYEEVSPPAPPFGSGAEDFAAAGRIAALIHQLPQHGHDFVHGIEREIDTAARWSAVLTVLGSADARRVAGLMSRLQARAPSMRPEELSVVHRDFYHGQLLRNAAACWVVDWDTVCRGHCELDIATYVAHAILDTALSYGAASAWQAGVRTFLDSYRTSGGCYDKGRLGWYLGCALCRLCAMHSARGRGSALAPLWQLAEILADNAVPLGNVCELADKAE